MTDLPFQRFTIGQFRGLRDLVLDDCRSINLLVGGNNSGKTSVLEALLLSANPTEIEQWEAAVQLRRTWPLSDRRAGSEDRLDALSWLFPRRERELQPIKLISKGRASSLVAQAKRIVGEPHSQSNLPPGDADGGKRDAFYLRTSEGVAEPGLAIEVELEPGDGDKETLNTPPDSVRLLTWQSNVFRIRLEPAEPDLPIAFATPISHRSDGYLATQVGRLLRSKTKLATVLDLLQEIDPQIADLVIVSPEDSELDGPMPRHFFDLTLHVEHADAGLIPIHAAGDGIRRAIHYAALLTDLGPGGVLLIDELEVGMHTSVLKDVFAWLGNACRESSIQLFATTHSLEAIDAILEGVPDEDLALYRLQDGEARRYAGELLRTARVELGQEVR